MTIDRSVASAIRNASRQELDMIIALVKARQSSLQIEAKQEFRIGDIVQFDANTRGVISGEITKINRKSIMVKATKGAGLTWKVAPSLLKKVTLGA